MECLRFAKRRNFVLAEVDMMNDVSKEAGG